MTLNLEDMKKPEECADCRFCDDDGNCMAIGESLWEYLPDDALYFPNGWKCEDCPLKESGDGWIPCDKKLPEDDEIKLVTLSGFGEKANRKVAFAGYDVKNRWWAIKASVIAWRPMPEPYMGGREPKIDLFELEPYIGE